MTGWEAGGLHAPQTPGNVTPSDCYLLLDLEPSGFVVNEDATKPDDGLYNCDEANVFALAGDYGVERPEASARGAGDMGNLLSNTIPRLSTAAISAPAASGLVLNNTTTSVFTFAPRTIATPRTFNYRHLH